MAPPEDNLSASFPSRSFSVGEAVNLSGTVTGATGPVSWSIESGSLGPDLTLSTSGVISGVANTAGSWDATLKVARGKAEATTTVSIRVNSLLQASNVNLYAVRGNSIVTTNIPVTGGVAPYSTVIEQNEFPTGIALSGLTVSGTTTASAGDYSSIIRVNDSGNQSKDALVNVKVRDVLVLAGNASPNPIYRGINYSYNVTASGGENPQVRLVDNTLAPGLSFSGNLLSGLITAVPNLNSSTGIGQVQLQFTASDLSGQTAANLSRTFQVYDLPSYTITKIGVLPFYAGVDTGAAFQTVTRAAPSPKYVITSGSLPAGLSLNADTGAITGTPGTRTQRTYSTTIRLTDAVGRRVDTNVSFEVIALPVVSSIATQFMVAGQPHSFPLRINGGEGPYFVSFNPSTSLNYEPSTGIVSGTLNETPGTTRTYTVNARDKNGVSAEPMTLTVILR